MSENITPDFLQDADSLLSENGFATSDVWYHGTASGLVDGIMQNGLKGGGDAETSARTQGTLATIGNRQFESNDPVFLTQSKELAFFWAVRKAHTRNLYFQTKEFPVVIRVTEPGKVSPDTGATALMLEPGNDYVDMIRKLFESKEISFPDDNTNPLTLPREFYLNNLAMGYSADPIPADKLSVVVPAKD